MGKSKRAPFSGQPIVSNAFTKHFESFFVIKRTKDEENFHTVSAFLVQKAISSTVGEVVSIRKLHSGDLLVEVNSRKQAQQLLKLKALATIPLNVSAHRTLNSSKGVITCGELFNVSLEEITQKLSSQGVTHVRRITIRRAGKLLETKHLVLTFNSPKAPESIKAGYLKLHVKAFIPNPLRCFKCQRFGHSKANCCGNLTCARCAEAGHESTDCTLKEKCTNCKGEHTFFSRACPKWKLEKEIVTTKVKKDVSFQEARRLVLAQTPTEGRSYASVTKSLRNCEAQTKPVTILSSDSDSDLISSPIKAKSSDFKKRSRISKARKFLTLKFSKKGASLKDLKSRKSVALEIGKAGLATKDLPSLFGNPSNSKLLKIHPSEDDEDFHMGGEQSATPLTGVDNSPPPTY
ncbi:uncharacterized protein LOC129956818 [Argiope bruennichi]|uniref:uncharacterized protein LOC129956818 n=1 Tax=Argiope bruennichi TaxID=94029 RepID=UPI002494CFE8|nr:uncharacterized protein LOC129956818 [Argiope bruennichi]